MRILVTGGAGYIGSFMVKALLDKGDEVFVADSLERGYKELLDSRAELLMGNVLDENFLSNVFENNFDAVMHFAAYISVEESMKNPGMYFSNNVFGTLKILEAMAKNGVNKFIFSSTGTVYGTPKNTPIPEEHSTNPENPYAESKLMVEKIISWYQRTQGISFAVLRYFNAAGGALDGSLGENHDPETHLIPNAIKAAIAGSKFTLFGSDYKTRDGTAIRDYIHVLDLVEAHLLTLKKLEESPSGYIYNVGTGSGSTNKEVVEMVRSVSGKDFPVENGPRRAGDVAETVADVSKIKQELGFSPKYSDLKTIVETAWKWHSRNV